MPVMRRFEPGDRRPCGDTQLPCNQVDPAGHFGDRMFDLDTRVDFHERERTVRGHEELHGSGTHVPDFRADRHGRILKPLRDAPEQEWRRGLLDKLLVAPLERAVPSADGDDPAIRVAEHLNFDVTRMVEEPFDETLPVAERGFGLVDGGFEGGFDIGEVAHDFHAAASPAVHCFDDDRQTVLTRECGGFLRVLDRLRGARGHGCADFRGDSTRFDFVSEHADGLR